MLLILSQQEADQLYDTHHNQIEINSERSRQQPASHPFSQGRILIRLMQARIF